MASSSPYSLSGSNPGAFDPSMYGLGPIDYNPDAADPNAFDSSNYSVGAPSSSGLASGGTDVLGGAGAGAAFGPWGAAAGAALGLGKYFLFDKPANDRQRTLAANTQKFSPWTGLSAQAPAQINPMSAGLSGAGMGLAMNQNMQNQQQMADLRASQVGLNDARTQKILAAPGTQTGLPTGPWSGASYWQKNPYTGG